MAWVIISHGSWSWSHGPYASDKFPMDWKGQISDACRWRHADCLGGRTHSNSVWYSPLCDLFLNTYVIYPDKISYFLFSFPFFVSTDNQPQQIVLHSFQIHCLTHTSTSFTRALARRSDVGNPLLEVASAFRLLRIQWTYCHKRICLMQSVWCVQCGTVDAYL